jgi:hypothetical protein
VGGSIEGDRPCVKTSPWGPDWGAKIAHHYLPLPTPSLVLSLVQFSSFADVASGAQGTFEPTLLHSYPAHDLLKEPR